MNEAVADIAPGGRIDLTREPDFSIAGVRVRPAACEMLAGDRRIRLQPRVMQVMIALARAGGQPVSREKMTEVCWGPVSVSEDALNRCIQRLRRLAQTEASGAFAIETIPKLGHRLTEDLAFARATEAAACLQALPGAARRSEAEYRFALDALNHAIALGVVRHGSGLRPETNAVLELIDFCPEAAQDPYIRGIRTQGVPALAGATEAAAWPSPVAPDRGPPVAREPTLHRWLPKLAKRVILTRVLPVAIALLALLYWAWPNDLIPDSGPNGFVDDGLVLLFAGFLAGALVYSGAPQRSGRKHRSSPG